MTAEPLRVLVADDDPHIMKCYLRAFGDASAPADQSPQATLRWELFGSGKYDAPDRRFELSTCDQGDDAVSRVAAAMEQDRPFDAVILDVRMPPGLDGVEAASQIRRLDKNVPIIFVTGYSDATSGEQLLRVPPPSKLHMFSKPLSFSDLVLEVRRIIDAEG